jgi:hypothetical protein
MVKDPDRSRGAAPLVAEYEFKPSLGWRVVYLVLVVIVVLARIVLESIGQSLPITLLWFLSALALGYLAVRAQFAGLTLTSDSIRVRGLLYSRTIPRSQVVRIHKDVHFPLIVRRSARGRERVVIVDALYTDIWNLPRNEAGSRRCLDRLETWVRE